MNEKPRDYRLTIERVNDRWQILEDGRLVTPVVAAGNTISWQAPKEADAYFQFPLNTLFKGQEDYTPRLRRGERVAYTITERTPPGTYVYATFCFDCSEVGVKASDYAEGGSPPRFIVMESG